MSRDYYAVLEIAIGATPAQVKRAYQRLARRYSPDVNLWDRDARSLFEEIVEAYRVLSDPSARGVYDRQGGQGRPQPERANPPASRCEHCAGVGTVWRREGMLTADRCPACGGSGERVSEPCPDCHGRG